MKVYRSLVGKRFKQSTTLSEVLMGLSGLSVSQLEEAADKGAVWIQKGRGKVLRERSLATRVSPQDTVTLFYDPKVLALPKVSGAECLEENEHYSVWMKPAGVVPQGTESGDHASLLRFVELHRGAEVFLVHRLDRETAGLMVFAHTKEAAAKLSELFQKSLIKKEYEAVVLGTLDPGFKGTIDMALDDKRAITHYEVLESREGRSLLKVNIETGRLHQIRRHFDHLGHPVMGDPKYGRGNKNREGLKLLACSLSFHDPWIKKIKTWVSSHHLSL